MRILPTGLESKKRTGARNTQRSISLCSFFEARSVRLKKSDVRMKEATTAAATSQQHIHCEVIPPLLAGITHARPSGQPNVGAHCQTLSDGHHRQQDADPKAPTQALQKVGVGRQLDDAAFSVLCDSDSRQTFRLGPLSCLHSFFSLLHFLFLLMFICIQMIMSASSRKGNGHICLFFRG